MQQDHLPYLLGFVKDEGFIKVKIFVTLVLLSLFL